MKTTGSLQFRHVCQRCLKSDKSVHQRELYSEHYSGPCGDSFCYASCSLEACRPVYATICDACAEEIKAKPSKPPKKSRTR